MGLNKVDLRSFGRIEATIKLISAFGLLTEFATIFYLLILRLGLSPLYLAYYLAVVILSGIIGSQAVLVRRRPSGDEDDLKVRFNVTISGEPARWVREWKRRRIFATNRDLLLRALMALRKEMLEMDLKSAELEKSRREEGYEEGL
ncbi:MAG: hypothetical protein QXM87_08305 [Candidatus Bathyarchaeia archaeon]